MVHRIFASRRRFSVIRLLPEGFRALWRLCSAPHLLGSGGELTKLNVAFQFENSAVAGVHEERVELGDRIGSGGTSDIYDCGACGFADARDCVLKVSRTTSAESYESFTSERSALLVAAALGLVPECVAFGERVHFVVHDFRFKSVDWPADGFRMFGGFVVVLDGQTHFDDAVALGDRHLVFGQEIPG